MLLLAAYRADRIAGHSILFKLRRVYSQYRTTGVLPVMAGLKRNHGRCAACMVTALCLLPRPIPTSYAYSACLSRPFFFCFCILLHAPYFGHYNQDRKILPICLRGSPVLTNLSENPHREKNNNNTNKRPWF